MEFRVYNGLPDSAKQIRNEVFVKEQGFLYEYDELDPFVTHIVLFDNGLPIATCRFFTDEQEDTYRLGRIAVLKEYRGCGIGSKIVAYAEQCIKKLGGKQIVLHAQCRAKHFYNSAGYAEYGIADDEEGVPHIWMKKEIDNMKKELFAIGEALIDFIPSNVGVNFDEVEAFSPKVGGAPANVLGAFAKLGGKTQMLTQLGDDPFGHKINNAFKGWGIGNDYVMFTDKANTALAFVSLSSDGNREFSFYRNPSADMLFSPDQVKREWFNNCFGLHFCSVSLGDTPMKAAHKAAIRYAKEAGAIISFDFNLRFPLWKNKEDLKAAVEEFLPYADIIKLSDEEAEFVAGSADIEKIKEKLLCGDTKLIMYTCGKDGAYAITREHTVYGEPYDAKPFDTTGAGDAFCGSFLYNLYNDGVTVDKIEDISQQRLEYYLECSNRYCGKSIQKAGAIDSYPTEL